MSSNLSVQFAKKQVDKALFESLYSNPYKFIQCSLDQLTHWEGVAPKMLVIINLFIQRATFSKGAHFTFPLRAIQKKTGFNKAHIIETIYQMEIMGLLKVNRRKNPEFTNMKRNNKQLPRGLKDIMYAGDIDLPNEYTLSKFFFIQEIRNKIKKFLPACRWFVPLVAFTISQALASLSLSLIQVPNVINNFSKSPRMEMIKRRVIRFTIPYKYSVFKAAACNYIKKEKEELLKKEKEKESSYMKHMADLALRALERKASLARQEDPTALPRHESVATGCAADKEGVKEGDKSQKTLKGEERRAPLGELRVIRYDSTKTGSENMERFYLWEKSPYKVLFIEKYGFSKYIEFKRDFGQQAVSQGNVFEKLAATTPVILPVQQVAAPKQQVAPEKILNDEASTVEPVDDYESRLTPEFWRLKAEFEARMPQFLKENDNANNT